MAGKLANMKMAAVEETVKGVLETPTAADFIKLAADAKPPAPTQKMIESPEMSGTLSPEDDIVGPDEGSWDIPLVLKGSGQNGVKPASAIFLRNSFGIESTPTGGTIPAASSPTATVITVTGSDFEENDACLVEMSGGNWEGAWITNVVEGSGEQTITLFPALSGAPSEGATVNPGIIYKPTSDELQKTLSIYYWLDGVKYSLAGCMGSPSFDFKYAEVPKLKMSMKLMTWTPSDEVCPFTPAYVGGTPFICCGGSFKLGSIEEYIENLSLDLAGDIAMLTAIQSTGAYDAYMSARKPAGSFDPFMNDASFLTAYKAGSTAEAHFSIGNHTNLIMARMPRIKYREVKPADKNGVNSYSVGYSAAKTVADDEVFLAFLSSVTP